MCISATKHCLTLASNMALNANTKTTENLLHSTKIYQKIEGNILFERTGYVIFTAHTVILLTKLNPENNET